MTITEPAAPIVELRDIRKSFAGITVLERIDFSIARGEVHALVGENGAGKSTLIKIIAGVHPPSAGRILLDGAETRFHSPLDARARGITVIHQEFSTVPHLSVAENILLGIQPKTRLGLVNRREMRRQASALLDSLAIALDPDALVAELSVADRQMVEIAKALARDARVLILDEPTATISGEEARLLFDSIRRLRRQGVGIIYISHRLDEIFDLADRVTILKDGRWMGTSPIGALDHDAIVSRMVGRPIQDIYPPKRDRRRGDLVLTVRDLRIGVAVKGCSLDLHKGEILGLAGMAGAGRTQLARGIFGGLASNGGEMRLRGSPHRPRGPRDALGCGIAYLTEDRKLDGLFLGQSVVANVTAATLSRHLAGRFLNRNSELSTVRRRIDELRIRVANPARATGMLSGGNQQKVLFARWLEADPEILILDEPTRGVDIGTKTEIYWIIHELARKGTAIMLISSELGELIGLGDRVVVMREGVIAGELSGPALTEENIVALATRRRAHQGAA